MFCLSLKNRPHLLINMTCRLVNYSFKIQIEICDWAGPRALREEGPFEEVAEEGESESKDKSVGEREQGKQGLGVKQ